MRAKRPVQWLLLLGGFLAMSGTAWGQFGGSGLTKSNVYVNPPAFTQAADVVQGAFVQSIPNAL